MESFWVAYGMEWLNLVARWLHVIVGIAWIGASFYFVWLDNNIRPPAPGSDLEKKGVAGELWAVHGGGFYNPQKYTVAPHELPEELHWFKWEAYATWLSGFALLLIVYYFNASSMMIDKSVADLAPWQAIGIGLGTLIVGWIVYDALCRSPLGKHDVWFGVVMFGFVTAVAFVLSTLLSGRAVYIHIGAMIGTIMAANVLTMIIPGQKKMVAAMREGKIPDAIHGIRGKQRSVHNNYFTLPVVFIMISNHYAMTYNHAANWLVLAAIIAAGVLIRHFFNLRHGGRTAWGYPAAGIAILLLVAILIAPKPPASASTDAGSAAAAKGPSFSQVQAILDNRCIACHAAMPTQAGFATAPAGIMLDRAELIRQHKDKIYMQVVQLKAMPLANLTKMTDEERTVIASWYQAGAK
jgi:uncharacterized membrane protein